MLVTEHVLYMGEVRDLTLEQIKRNCFTQFAINLKRELLENKPYPHKSGLQNYEFFNKEYGKKIQYNNKNITYKEMFSDLKDFCGQFFGLIQKDFKNPPTCVGAFSTWEVPTKEEYDTKVKKIWEETGMYTDSSEYENIKLCGNFTEFFGKGEFPFMEITLLRLGNQDYYFAQIVR